MDETALRLPADEPSPPWPDRQDWADQPQPAESRDRPNPRGKEPTRRTGHRYVRGDYEGINAVSLRPEQLALVRALKLHAGPLLGAPEIITAAGVCDARGWMLDVIGEADTVRTLFDLGFCPGLNVLRHTPASALRRALEYYSGDTAVVVSATEAASSNVYGEAAAPLRLTASNECVGAVCLWVRRPLADDAGTTSDLSLVVRAVAVGMVNWLELDERRRDLQRIHHGLVSHLDYHIVYVNQDGEIEEERHPVPPSETVRARMHEWALGHERSDVEVVWDGRIYRANVRRLWDANGRYKGKLGLFQDVTQRKQLDWRIRDVEKLSILTSLAAGIAHEIRNPLTTARGFLQLFAERMASETDKQFLDLTIQELDRIHRLVVDFMSLAKPSAQEFGNVNLSDVLRSTTEFIRPEALLRGVVLETDIPAEDLWVWGDAKQIKQVVLNIAQNALQACEADGRVTLSLRACPHRVILQIRDTGCGIPPEDMPRVFQPFYTTKKGGTGLGLAISKRIVEEHQGRIDIESAVGQGTTVEIELPRVQRPDALTAGPDANR